MFQERILIGTKEPGAAAYFAALLKKSRARNYRILAYPKASIVFNDQGIESETIEADNASHAREIIESFKPSKVYISLSLGDTFEKKLLIEAKKLGIPVFVFLDSYLNLWQRFADKTGAKRWHYKPDKIFVINDFSRRRIIQQGAPKKIVSILTHPLLTISKQSVNEVPVFNRREVCKKLRIPVNAKIILFVSEYRFLDSKIWKWDQPSPFDLGELLKVTVKAARILTEDCEVPSFVIIKKHPTETAERINLIPENQRKFCRSVATFDKASLLEAADIVTGLTSVLLSEAAERNKIVFSYHHYPSDKTAWFSSINPKIIEMESKAACTRLLIKTLLT